MKFILAKFTHQSQGNFKIRYIFFLFFWYFIFFVFILPFQIYYKTWHTWIFGIFWLSVLTLFYIFVAKKNKRKIFNSNFLSIFFLFFLFSWLSQQNLFPLEDVMFFKHPFSLIFFLFSGFFFGHFLLRKIPFSIQKKKYVILISLMYIGLFILILFFRITGVYESFVNMSFLFFVGFYLSSFVFTFQSVPDISCLTKEKVLVPVLFFLILCISFFNFSYKLSDVAFSNDEVFQLEAAVGYNKTGQFVRWDFQRQEPMYNGTYTRAWPYTLQLAAILNFFPIDEYWARIASVLWGIVTLTILFFITRYYTKNNSISLVVMGFGTMSETLYWASTTLRMYSMLAALSLLFVFVADIFLHYHEEFLQRYFLKGKKKLHYTFWLRYSFFLLCVALLALILFFVHSISTVLILGFVSAFFFRTCYLAYTKKSYSLVLLSCVFILVLIYVVIFHFAMRLESLGLNKPPLFDYFWYLFQDMKAAVVMFGFCLVGMYWFIRKNRWWLPYIWFMGLFSMIFFATRYPAAKYILFISPLTWLLSVVGIWVITHNIGSGIVRVCIRVCFIIIFGIFIGLPYFPKVSFITDTSYAEHRFEDFGNLNIKVTYEYVDHNRTDNEPVFIRNLQTFYLQEVHFSPRLFPETYDDLMNDINAHDYSWYIFPQDKQSIFSEAIFEFLDSRCEFFSGLQEEYLMSVYRCSKLEI